jgi:Carboxypeptidase regulatory-like domain
MGRILVLWPLFFPSVALACQCAAPFPVCQRVALSDIVFIGTVESIAPHFLDYWNPTQQQSLTLLNAETARAQADRSAASLAAAKDAYTRIFPDLPEDSKKVLEGAQSREDLVKAFYRILGSGRRVRFRVREAYRGDEDEDEILDVWTPFGDCGFDFQTGETYLVYADDDEESSTVSTDTCSGTQRLSDAGSDLAYLYSFENNGDDSARLDGFATTNQFHQLDVLHVEAPVAGVVVELKAASGSRFTESGADGKFVFDGLAAGDYTLTAYAAGYPKVVQQLAAPQRVRVAAKGCAAATLLIFKPPDR